MKLLKIGNFGRGFVGYRTRSLTCDTLITERCDECHLMLCWDETVHSHFGPSERGPVGIVRLAAADTIRNALKGERP
jgi:hypothetical protein